jgi:hypothetical protein
MWTAAYAEGMMSDRDYGMVATEFMPACIFCCICKDEIEEKARNRKVRNAIKGRDTLCSLTSKDAKFVSMIVLLAAFADINTLSPICTRA